MDSNLKISKLNVFIRVGQNQRISNIQSKTDDLLAIRNEERKQRNERE